jgi:hypothetical protein
VLPRNAPVFLPENCHESVPLHLGPRQLYLCHEGLGQFNVLLKAFSPGSHCRCGRSNLDDLGGWRSSNSVGDETHGEVLQSVSGSGPRRRGRCRLLDTRRFKQFPFPALKDHLPQSLLLGKCRSIRSIHKIICAGRRSVSFLKLDPSNLRFHVR